MTWDEWQEKLGDRVCAEAQRKRVAAGPAEATFEQFLTVFERWVYAIYCRYEGMHLSALRRLARQEGCPRSDVERFWEKLTKWKAKKVEPEEELWWPGQPYLFLPPLPSSTGKKPPLAVNKKGVEYGAGD
jgi:hypothetical protein